MSNRADSDRPPDPVVVDQTDLVGRQAQQGRVELLGPLTQRIQRPVVDQQVAHHHPDRRRRGQPLPGVARGQVTFQQPVQPQPVDERVDDRQTTELLGGKREPVGHGRRPRIGGRQRIDCKTPSHATTTGHAMPDDTPDVPAPQADRHAEIVDRLGQFGFALPGTITVRTKTCGKANCRCHDDPDQRHGPYIQWTRTVDGKTVTKQLTTEQLERYQAWFDNTRLLRDLIDQLHTVSIDAIIAAEGWGAES